MGGDNTGGGGNTDDGGNTGGGGGDIIPGGNGGDTVDTKETLVYFLDTSACTLQTITTTNGIAAP